MKIFRSKPDNAELYGYIYQLATYLTADIEEYIIGHLNRSVDRENRSGDFGDFRGRPERKIRVKPA